MGWGLNGYEILVVEVADSGINWMEPRDLPIDDISPSINPTSGHGISSHHPGGAIVVFVGGSTHFLPTDLDQKTLAALLTRDGGEDLDMDDIGP